MKYPGQDFHLQVLHRIAKNIGRPNTPPASAAHVFGLLSLCRGSFRADRNL
jgi:hypothetical protein